MYFKVLGSEYNICRNKYFRVGFSKAKDTNIEGTFGMHWVLYLVFIVIFKWRGTKCT
jgi:hypothetical protein